MTCMSDDRTQPCNERIRRRRRRARHRVGPNECVRRARGRAEALAGAVRGPPTASFRTRSLHPAGAICGPPALSRDTVVSCRAGVAARPIPLASPISKGISRSSDLSFIGKRTRPILLPQHGESGDSSRNRDALMAAAGTRRTHERVCAVDTVQRRSRHRALSWPRSSQRLGALPIRRGFAARAPADAPGVAARVPRFTP